MTPAWRNLSRYSSFSYVLERRNTQVALFPKIWTMRHLVLQTLLHKHSRFALPRFGKSCYPFSTTRVNLRPPRRDVSRVFTFFGLCYPMSFLEFESMTGFKWGSFARRRTTSQANYVLLTHNSDLKRVPIVPLYSGTITLYCFSYVLLRMKLLRE